MNRTESRAATSATGKAEMSATGMVGYTISGDLSWPPSDHASNRQGVVNAGEKMHRRAGVKMHHGRSQVSAKPNAAFQFDQ
jgi:hypothetical protein